MGIRNIILILLLVITGTKSTAQTKIKVEDLFQFIKNSNEKELTITITNVDNNNIKTVARAINCSNKRISIILIGKKDKFTSIPDNFLDLGPNEFNRSLKEITIPSSVKIIGKSAFNGCSSLEHIIFSKKMGHLSEIGEYAFNNCYNLKEIKIPQTTKKIKMGAFAKCSSLKQITIPQNITEIGVFSFSECDSLSNITILSNKMVIRNNIIEGSKSLTEVTMGPEVKEIEYSFINNNTTIKKIILEGKTKLGKINENKDNENIPIIYVKPQYLKQYKETYPGYKIETIKE